MDDKFLAFYKQLKPEQQQQVSDYIQHTTGVLKYAFKVLPNELIHQTISQTVDALVEDSKQKVIPKFSCQKGCSHCCSQMVHVAQYEAIAILDKHQIDVDKLKRQLKHSKDYKDWFNLSLEDRKCVFLKDNLCSIYDDRPIRCRNHLTHEPPERCIMPEKIEDDHPLALFSRLEIEVVLNAIEQFSKLGPMPQMFLDILEGKCEK